MMREVPIIRSPHAYVPREHLTEEEQNELYRTRIDDTYQPYTVIDVLTRVYHRSFEDDLSDYMGAHPEDFLAMPEGWQMSRAWVNECRIMRIESLFFQPLSDFQVDILVRTVCKMELVRTGNAQRICRKTIKSDVRLRYSLDLRPCKLTCHYCGAIADEKRSLLSLNPGMLRTDKYLLPYIQEEDYPTLARWIRQRYEIVGRDGIARADRLAAGLELKILHGHFPENGVMGEIYFNHSRATIIDETTGEIAERNIDPGTIVINAAACTTEGMYNSTLFHECVHHIFARIYFLLQRTHGRKLCSYLCKRKGKEVSRESSLSPLDIMEIHANKLPGYIQIDGESAKRTAEEYLAAYGDRSPESMKRLIRDMADRYGATQQATRTRLRDMGYSEVAGIYQTANGRPVPAYLSDLENGQNYTISHEAALKEYVRNPDFRMALDSGRYVYCEGHFCLNTPKYIQTDHLAISI